MNKAKPTIKGKIEKGFEILDYLRRFLINISVLFIIFVLVKFFLNDSKETILIIEPFIVSQPLIEKGYSGDVLTIILIDNLNKIQNSSTSFASKYKLIIPRSKDKIDNVRNTYGSGSYNELINIIIELFAKKPIVATGIVILKDSIYNISFRIEGKDEFNMQTHNLDDLLPIAEYIAKYYDMNSLAAYYAYNNNRIKCLEMSQIMMIDNDDKNDQYAYFLRGRIYGLNYSEKKENSDRNIAIQMLKKSLGKGENKSPSYNLLGFIFELDEQLDSAKLMYNYAIANNINYAGAYLNIGNVFSKEYKKDTLIHENLDSALLFYNKAIELEPMMIEAYVNCGALLYLSNKKNESLNLLNKAIELEPNNPISYLQLGLLLAQANQKSSALIYLEKVIELDSKGIYRNIALNKIDEINKLQ
jgi:tetratricopeptide (TPR) repeat protein